jgi:hypothetical protein
MATKATQIPLPPTGFINELARITGFTRQCVSRAVRHNSKGDAANAIRKKYRELYVNPYLTGKSDSRQLSMNL